MASNFDFLKDINSNLFSIIEDAQKLFRDGYFNQCVVQVRIFAEKMARDILKGNDSLTFDDTLNCLKDRVKQEREKEFIDDLFFIKKEGNKCAHGEDTTAMTTLEVLKRAFEASINYAYAIKQDENIDKLRFDETLLITTKPRSENSIVEKYVELAENKADELEQNLKLKQKQQKEEKKKLIKEKVKKAKKFLSQNVNQKVKNKKITTSKTVQKTKKNKETSKQSEINKKNFIKPIIFTLFALISIFFIAKFLF